MDLSTINWTEVVIAVILFTMTTIAFPLIRTYIAKIKDARVREIITDAVNSAEQWAKNQSKAGVTASGASKLLQAVTTFNAIDKGKSGLDAATVTNLIEAAVGKLNTK